MRLTWLVYTLTHQRLSALWNPIPQKPRASQQKQSIRKKQKTKDGLNRETGYIPEAQRKSLKPFCLSLPSKSFLTQRPKSKDKRPMHCIHNEYSNFEQPLIKTDEDWRLKNFAFPLSLLGVLSIFICLNFEAKNPILSCVPTSKFKTNFKTFFLISWSRLINYS